MINPFYYFVKYLVRLMIFTFWKFFRNIEFDQFYLLSICFCYVLYLFELVFYYKDSDFMQKLFHSRLKDSMRSRFDYFNSWICECAWKLAKMKISPRASQVLSSLEVEEFPLKFIEFPCHNQILIGLLDYLRICDTISISLFLDNLAEQSVLSFVINDDDNIKKREIILTFAHNFDMY